MKPGAEIMGQIVREVERRGYTEQEIARKMGVAQVSVHRWLSGERSPTLGPLSRLAAAVGCKITLTPKRGGEIAKEQP